MNFMQRRIALEQKITESAQRYYTDGQSEVSDKEFDDMVAELKQIAPDSEVLHKVGWGYEVGKDSTPGEKVKHKYGEAGSLDKAYNWNELNKQLKVTEVDASLKLDGLSVVLYYTEGRLTRALTRGDGITGIDITDKAIKMLRGKEVIGLGFTGAVRGEIIMSYDNWEEFSSLHPEAKNPRNSAAGLVNGSEVSDELRFLDIVVYSVVGSDNFQFGRGTMWSTRAWLQVEFEDMCVPYKIVDLSEESKLEETMYQLRKDWDTKYRSDGIVLTCMKPTWDSETQYISYDAQAFKFPSEEKDSTVESVIWKMSKTRYCIPKIKVTPVQLEGTTVQHATCFNAQYVKDNLIGPGAVVTLEKHGCIIPNINKVVQPSYADVPTHCLSCGAELVWEGVHLKCLNDACGNATMQDIQVWCKTLAPVDGMGDLLREKFLTSLFDKTLTVDDLMDGRLTKYAEQKDTLAATGQAGLFISMCGQLCKGKFELATALEALNIPRLGNLTAKKFAEHPDDVQFVLKHLAQGDDPMSCCRFVEFIAGPATAESIANNKDKFLRLMLIKDQIDWAPKAKVAVKAKVAITGKLSVSRDQFIQELNAAGYTVGDISKDTKFLITDSPGSNTSKNVKADKLGIQKITEQDFRSNYM